MRHSIFSAVGCCPGWIWFVRVMLSERVPHVSFFYLQFGESRLLLSSFHCSGRVRRFISVRSFSLLFLSGGRGDSRRLRGDELGFMLSLLISRFCLVDLL